MMTNCERTEKNSYERKVERGPLLITAGRKSEQDPWWHWFHLSCGEHVASESLDWDRCLEFTEARLLEAIDAVRAERAATVRQSLADRQRMLAAEDVKEKNQ